MRKSLVMLTLLLLSMSCKAKQEAEEEPTPDVTVQTALATVGPFVETLGAIGTVAPRSGHVAALTAPAAARISQVLVTTGQHVRRGETLVTLDDAPFRAALQAAEATLVAAEKANDRQQRLANEGIVPRRDAEAAAAELARARSEVVAAQRTVQLSVITSPMDGVVTDVKATLGATADPAQSLIGVADPSALDIFLNATPTDAARVRPGARVALRSGSASEGEPLGESTVADVSATVDSMSRTVAIRIRAPLGKRPLKIGETVFGAITLRTRSNAVVIPSDALVPDGETFNVFVVDANGIAHEQEVKIGGKSDAGVEITEGLTGGERIVTTGAYGVTDSAHVRTAAGRSPPRKRADEPQKP